MLAFLHSSVRLEIRPLVQLFRRIVTQSHREDHYRLSAWHRSVQAANARSVDHALPIPKLTVVVLNGERMLVFCILNRRQRLFHPNIYAPTLHAFSLPIFFVSRT